MARGDLTEEPWERLAPHLPPEQTGKRGGQWRDHRTVLNGILWIVRTGAPWRDLPERYGPWHTAHDRLARWQRTGLWTRLLQTLQADADADGGVEWDGCAADSVSIKAHPHAAGAPRDPAPPPTEAAAEKGGAASEPALPVPPAEEAAPPPAEEAAPPPAEEAAPPPAEEAAPTRRLSDAAGGGLTTKIHLCADGRARPLSLVLSEGQCSDSTYLQATLDAVRVPRRGRGRPRKRPGKLRADKGYSYPACRAALRRRGQKHLIPERRDQRANRQKKGQAGGRPVVFVKEEYARRNVVERCILRLKQFRRVATRYEKRESHFLAVVTLAAIILWLR